MENIGIKLVQKLPLARENEILSRDRIEQQDTNNANAVINDEEEGEDNEEEEDDTENENEYDENIDL